MGEAETLRLVVAGRSVARYGDGEFKMVGGASIKSQQADSTLADRLRNILLDSGECLVGIPNLESATPKAPFWEMYRRSAKLLMRHRPYVSSFVTRPDSAPWINVPEYWAMLESLWIGQDVTLVRGSQKSLMADDLIGAASVTEIVGPRQHAWASYADLMAQIGTPKRALLCLGPTATVMAVDLCAKGVHAIDLGHIGMFLRKHRRGEPMVRTEADKVAP
jgi:hypothetical protein